MTRNYHHVSHDELVRVTRALLKFCREHQHAQATLAFFRGVLGALEANDFKTAAELYRSFPSGRFCWDDWFPPVVFDHEDGDYVCTVFNALVERWHRLMRTAIGESG